MLITQFDKLLKYYEKVPTLVLFSDKMVKIKFKMVLKEGKGEHVSILVILIMSSLLLSMF